MFLSLVNYIEKSFKYFMKVRISYINTSWKYSIKINIVDVIILPYPKYFIKGQHGYFAIAFICEKSGYYRKDGFMFLHSQLQTRCILEECFACRK